MILYLVGKCESTGFAKITDKVLMLGNIFGVLS